MRRDQTLLFSVLLSAVLIGCGGGGGETLTGEHLSTSAPDTVQLASNTQATYSVTGGVPAYVATTGSSKVVLASLNGGQLSLTAMSAGSTSVTVVDRIGTRISFNVVVSGAAQGTELPISLNPASLSVGNCTSRIPFIFSGGVGPYTVLTTDNFHVPVSSPLPLGDGRFYFFADIHFPANVPTPPLVQTLTVLDSQSHTAAVALTTAPSLDPCPSNPLLTISPETANLRETQILAYQVNGGPSPASNPTVRFADAQIAEVVSVSPSAIQIRGLRTGSTLMTVQTADQQMASVVIHVLPQ